MANSQSDLDNKAGFPILVAGAELEFTELMLPDRRVEVQQILRTAGFNPTLDHRLVEPTFPGTNTWDEDETLDLKSEQPRNFLIGKSDRLYSFAIDDVVYELPFEEIGEPQLRRLACIEDDKVLVLALEGEPDLELGTEGKVSLSGAEVERIYSRPKTVTVCLDDEGNRELPRGSYLFKKLVALLGIPAGYVLSYVSATGKLMSLKEGDSVELYDGIKFFSHSAGGGAS